MNARSGLSLVPVAAAGVVLALLAGCGSLLKSKAPAEQVYLLHAAMPGAPPVQPETTLRDALSALLASSVQLGVVVDDRDRVLGLVSVDAIGERLREPVRSESGPAQPAAAAEGAGA